MNDSNSTFQFHSPIGTMEPSKILRNKITLSFKSKKYNNIIWKVLHTLKYIC